MTITNQGGPPPTVVFIAQLGTGGDSWQPVLDYLGGLPSFIYDRPGTGQAPPRPSPNPTLPYGGFAQELEELLEQQDVPYPVLLVGHSFGGLIARAFAGLWPDRVAGMVFVDGSIPQFHLLPSAEAKRDGNGPDATEIDTVSGEVEILSATLPQVPTLVLTRTPGRWSGAEEPPHPRVEDLWLAHQRILARETGAKLIVAYNSSHQMPQEVPDLVAFAVREVHDAVMRMADVGLDRAVLAAVAGRLDH